MSEYTETLDHVMTLVEPTEMIAPLPRWSRSSRQLACLNDHSRTMVLNAHGGVLAPSANPEAILERIADDYEKRTQWVVTRSTEATPGRLEFIKLENDSGMRAYVSVRVDTAQAQLETLGHTACFSQPRVTIDQSR
ncbi:hypothetical protein [Microcella putealis]|nr:hypothetical protein [Microcella putealis]